MKVKLIQSGGFAGIKKTAETDLNGLTAAVQQKLQTLFEQPEHARPAKSPMRDKEQLFLELNGKVVNLNTISLDKDLHDLIQRMKGDLDY